MFYVKVCVNMSYNFYNTLNTYYLLIILNTNYFCILTK